MSFHSAVATPFTFPASHLVGPRANRPGSPGAAGDLGDEVAAILIKENGQPPSASGQPAATPVVATVATPAPTTTPARPAPAAAAGDYGDRVAAILVAENGGHPPRAP
jgi:hypothetical protein